jgi:hypothetical protein
MNNVAIQSVALGADGLVRVKVRPLRFPDYSDIWGSATSVRWDNEAGELYTLEIKGFSAADYLKQITSAVQSEYGDRLTIESETDLASIPKELAAKLRDGFHS